MEVFLITCLCAIFLINALMFREISRVIVSCQNHDHHNQETHLFLEAIAKDIESIQKKLSVLSTLESASPQSPMKPNNWDSIREAFKGPVRTDVNERT